ncbi:glycoside hydrolase family 2 TIM barrel-domain containing protein [Pleomorphovibrio marinus]|uniref:glycoside hydrolase family 2 TIM barrel-domain containing protein n=1 Tax=Pleomorphovibrio marinus TaxID=2164132 RepID=UPI000E0B7C09|nr:glycoside hydrolase family 2 TIM barrel-domain containing protein [Pleomorphovibrio marinus]
MKGVNQNISLIVCCLFLVVGAGTIAFAQSEEEYSLNGVWQFATDPNSVGESEEWFQEGMNTEGWDEIGVPGNWDLLNEYSHYVGKGWYSKKFTLPSDWEAKDVILDFEAVYHDCTVWLNGEKLGENDSGFLPFEFEVTELLHPTQENTLVVCADNTFKRGAIWNWGGIRRPVKLKAYDGLRITRQHITPSVDLENNEAKVSIRLYLENFKRGSEKAEGNVVLTANNGYRQVLPFSTSIPAEAHQEIVLDTQIRKKDVHLWHFDDPFLYHSTVNLKGHETPVLKDAFGLRKIEIDEENKRFLLNGESVRLMGLNLVPDSRTTGNVLPLWQIQRDVDLLKSLNGNFARLSHLPLPEEMLNYLDQRGILIISEIPLWGYDPLADPDNDVPFDWLKRLVTLQYNHPSVVGWSTGNEIGYFPSAKQYVEKSIDFVRSLDSTRLVSNVTYTAQFDDDYIRFTDIGLLNKYGKNLAPITRLQHEKHPDKVMFYSEYGIGQFGEGLDATLDIKPLLDSLRDFPYLVGASIWTYNDYRSSYVGTQELSENRPWGVVDTYRRKKQAFFDLQKEHAPIRALNVNVEGSKAEISLRPRTALDLPAHPMRGYKIVYQLMDADEKVMDGGFFNLPDIQPGDQLLNLSAEWKTEQAHALEIALVTPEMDIVLDTAIYFQKPVKPILFHAFGGRTQQNNVPQNSGGVRVFYEPSPHSTTYKLKYGKDKLDQETPATRESYIDIQNLELDQNYNMQLVAINSMGESISDPKEVKVDQRNFLPPAVRYVEPSHEGFFVAYASEETDFVYRVRYRGENGEEKILQSRTPGLTAVRGLENGKPYSFEVQRVTDNNSYSLWSKTFTVIPDGDQVPPIPRMKGVLKKGKEALVTFLPVPKAIGYEIQYRESGRDGDNWNTITLNRSEVSFCQVSQLKPNRSYEFRMAAINSNGKSAYSQVIKL